MGSSDGDIRDVARRAVGRVRASLDAPAPSGTFVHDAPRPGPAIGEKARNDARSGALLVTADDVRSVPEGGALDVPRGACVTPLAVDEAFRRHVRLAGPGAPRASGSAPGSRVAVGSDHGGRERKADVVAFLREQGYSPIDLGTHDDGPCDYPDFAAAVARSVAQGEAEIGVIVDGAGIGSAMVANKVPGILAANCWDVDSARNAREHNHANVLTLGAGRLSRLALFEVLRAFLATPAGAGRHARRVAMIHALGAQYARARVAAATEVPS